MMNSKIGRSVLARRLGGNEIILKSYHDLAGHVICTATMHK